MFGKKQKRTVSSNADHASYTTSDVRDRIREFKKLADKANKSLSNADKPNQKLRHDIKLRLHRSISELVDQKLNCAFAENKDSRRKYVENCQRTGLDVIKRLHIAGCVLSTDSLDTETDNTFAKSTDETESLMTNLNEVVDKLQAIQHDNILPIKLKMLLKVDENGKVELIQQIDLPLNILPQEDNTREVTHYYTDTGDTLHENVTHVDKSELRNMQHNRLSNMFASQNAIESGYNTFWANMNQQISPNTAPVFTIGESTGSRLEQNNLSEVTSSDSDNMSPDAVLPHGTEHTDTESYGCCHPLPSSSDENDKIFTSVDRLVRNFGMMNPQESSILQLNTGNGNYILSRKINNHPTREISDSLSGTSSIDLGSISPSSTLSGMSSIFKTSLTSDSSNYCFVTLAGEHMQSDVSSAASSGHMVVNASSHSNDLLGVNRDNTNEVELEYLCTCEAKIHRSDCVIPDITVLESNKIVLADHYHQNLQLLGGANFSFLTQQECPHPMGICHIHGERFGVALRRNRQIRLYAVEENTFIHQNTIDIQCNYYVWNILHRNGHFYVVCDENNIHVIDMTGVETEIIRTNVPTTTGYIRYFDVNSNASRFYLCTMTGLICINKQGRQIWALTGDGKDFGHMPEDICLFNGRLLATHWMGNKIFEISLDGKFVRDITTSHLQHPRAMSVSPQKTFLVVSQFHPQMSVHESKNRELQIFKLN